MERTGAASSSEGSEASMAEARKAGKAAKRWKEWWTARRVGEGEVGGVGEEKRGARTGTERRRGMASEKAERKAG